MKLPDKMVEAAARAMSRTNRPEARLALTAAAVPEMLSCVDLMREIAESGLLHGPTMEHDRLRRATDRCLAAFDATGVGENDDVPKRIWAGDEPLANFQEGQWWVKELDAEASKPEASADFRRAVATVHHMLRAAKKAPAGEPSDPAMPAEEWLWVAFGELSAVLQSYGPDMDAIDRMRDHLRRRVQPSDTK